MFQWAKCCDDIELFFEWEYILSIQKKNMFLSGREIFMGNANGFPIEIKCGKTYVFMIFKKFFPNKTGAASKIQDIQMIICF